MRTRALAAAAALSFFAMSFVPAAAGAGVAVSVGKAAFWESTTDGRQYEARMPMAFRACYAKPMHGVFLEYFDFKVSQKEEPVQVTREHRELQAVFRQFLFRTKLTPFVAGGLGAQQESVRTRFFSESRKSRGGYDPIGSFAAGLVAMDSGGLELQLELRGTSKAAYFDPVYGVVFFLGFRF